MQKNLAENFLPLPRNP